MKRKKPMGCFLLALMMLLCVSLPGGAEETGESFTVQALVERLVISYAAYGERDDEAMEELSAVDPAAAEKWARILDLWEAPVTANAALPEDLPQDDTLCLVALGFQLNPDGTMREELLERLKVLLTASRQYPNALIVCTGGGTAADDPAATEAGRMAEWLREQGVDPARIYVEDQSVTTAQNAIFTFDILAESCPQVTKIAIISSDYHIATGALLFGAEAMLRNSGVSVVSNASWHAPSGTLSVMFQAGALIELSGDMETAFEIYFDTYDIHELPPLRSADQEKGRVVVLATGGTIAGIGEDGKTAGYIPGVLTAEELLMAVPELAFVAPIEAIQVCNVNSDDITAEVWLTLANIINEMAKDPTVAGFVITHGTDTLEETAYFLTLTVKTDKPVVITGAMRPLTAISADGPMNLYQAVCVAASKEAVGRGVLAVFSDRIYSARSVTKTSTYHVTAIAAGEMGAIGVVRDGDVYIYETPVRKHTMDTVFDVSALETLPSVSILYFAVDADPELLRFAAGRSDGLVIAGAGAGEFSEKYMDVIGELSIPVVISSRINDGVITRDNLLCANTIAADNLPPQKAAILLRLALTTDADMEEIEKMFLAY